MHQSYSLIDQIMPLMQKTGAAILSIYDQSEPYSITAKSDHSPLTQADCLAHQLIVQGLEKITPSIPILSEENPDIPFKERQSWEQYWLIDPLDGTRSFIQHTGEFTINVALIEHHRPIVGIIYVPITKECYYAQAGSRTVKTEATGHGHVLCQQTLKRPTVMLTSHGANQNFLTERFKNLGDFQLKRLSSAWKFCLLAERKAAISPRFGDTSEWDTAAGQCILEQAGGGIFDLAGNPLRYNTKKSLINPHFIAIADTSLKKHLQFNF